MSLITKGYPNKIITKGLGSGTTPIVTSRQGTVLELTSGSQSVQLKIGKAHVTVLTIVGIYTGQSELPSVDLTDSDGNVLETHNDIATRNQRNLNFQPPSW